MHWLQATEYRRIILRRGNAVGKTLPDAWRPKPASTTPTAAALATDTFAAPPEPEYDPPIPPAQQYRSDDW